MADELLLKEIALLIRQNTTPYVSLRDGQTISSEEIAQAIFSKVLKAGYLSKEEVKTGLKKEHEAGYKDGKAQGYLNGIRELGVGIEEAKKQERERIKTLIRLRETLRDF